MTFIVVRVFYSINHVLSARMEIAAPSYIRVCVTEIFLVSYKA